MSQEPLIRPPRQTISGNPAPPRGMYEAMGYTDASSLSSMLSTSSLI